MAFPDAQEQTPVGLLVCFTETSRLTTRYIVELRVDDMTKEQLHCSASARAAYHYYAGFLTAVHRMSKKATP